MPHSTRYAQIGKSQHESSNAATERLLEVYNIAIVANVSGDKETLAHSLALLKTTLNPDEDLLLAQILFDLYTLVEAASSRGEPETAAKILETLRGYWLAKKHIEQLKK
jgi:hypothetical protein